MAEALCSCSPEKCVSIDLDSTVHAAIKCLEPQILEAFSADAKKAGLVLQNEDGSINRRALGAIVFSDPELLRKQENIVYPFVRDKVNAFIEENAEKDVIINATVLYKTPDLLQRCEKIFFVKANLFKRFFRARRRDKMPVSRILDRFRSQKDLLKKYRDAATGIPVEIIKN